MKKLKSYHDSNTRRDEKIQRTIAIIIVALAYVRSSASYADDEVYKAVINYPLIMGL